MAVLRYKNPTTNSWDILNGIISSSDVPIGGIIEYSSLNAPNGWLLCDGRAVSRTEYKDLFDVVGTIYGEGDGSTTFNLPNKQGKVSVGLDFGDTDFNTLGKTGGEKTHKLTVDEMPKTSFRIPHVPYYDDCLVSGGGYTQTRSSMSREAAANTVTNEGWHVLSTGGDKAHNNIQPYITTNYIIKYRDISNLTPTAKVVDNLTSSSMVDALSANQGRILKETIDANKINFAVIEANAQTVGMSGNLNYTNVNYGDIDTSKIITSFVIGCANTQSNNLMACNIAITNAGVKSRVTQVASRTLGTGNYTVFWIGVLYRD